MLPSKGYFANVPCPHTPKKCTRPYCHFRHSKDRGQPEREESEEVIEGVVKETVKKVLLSRRFQEEVGQGNWETEKIVNIVLKEMENEKNSEQGVPYYNPTPISELNMRHIPVVLPPFKPTYSNIGRAKKITNNYSSYLQRKENDLPYENNTSEIVKSQGGITTACTQFNTNYESPSSNGGGYNEYNLNRRNSNSSYIEKRVDKTSLSIPDVNPDVDKERLPHQRRFSASPADMENKKERFVSSESKKSSRFEEESADETVDSISLNEPVNPHNGEVGSCSNNSNELQFDGIKKETKKQKQKKRSKNKGKNSGDVNTIVNKDKDMAKAYSDVVRDSPSSREKRKSAFKLGSPKKTKLEKEPEDDEEPVVVMEKREPEVCETIVINSSASNSPEQTTYGKESPPPKRKKDSNSDICPSSPHPSEFLCERWRKAREKILCKEKLDREPKIKPVSNVQVLLRAKDQFFSNQKTVTQAQREPLLDSSVVSLPRATFRKAHVPPANIARCPKVFEEDGLKIPYFIRQQALQNIFDEFSHYVSPTVAYERAQKMELEICRRLNVVKTYKNKVALAILRIRQQKGLIFEREIPKEMLRSNSVPLFTHGWTLYKCFSEYLLTEEEYRTNGFPMKMKSNEGCAYIEISARRPKAKQPSGEFEQTCDYCSQTYFVDKAGFPVKEYDCFYHWGKLRRLRVCGGYVEKYTCCGGEVDSEPCTNGKYHVCNLFDDNLLKGFVSTRSQRKGENPHVAGIFGIDCEMCYTTKGIELTRCTLVDLNGQAVYDKIVVPDNPIIDYCTRFSGITEDIMKTSKLKLKDIQNDLLKIINEHTILVGHSLENDLKVLKIFHKTLVDTSVVFPHKNGLPLKLSLKKIAKDLLNLTIQENENGHDSYEDANACIQIMLWKIKEDAKKRKPRIIISIESNYKKESVIKNK